MFVRDHGAHPSLLLFSPLHLISQAAPRCHICLVITPPNWPVLIIPSELSTYRVVLNKLAIKGKTENVLRVRDLWQEYTKREGQTHTRTHTKRKTWVKSDLHHIVKWGDEQEWNHSAKYRMLLARTRWRTSECFLQNRRDGLESLKRIGLHVYQSTAGQLDEIVTTSTNSSNSAAPLFSQSRLVVGA